MEKREYNRIKAVLVDKGLKSKKLAEHLSVTDHTVSRWCTNDAQPAIPQLFKIADYLKVDVRELLVPNILPSSAEVRGV